LQVGQALEAVGRRIVRVGVENVKTKALIPRGAQHPAKRRIDEKKPALPVDRENAVGRMVDQLLIPRVSFADFTFHAPVLGGQLFQLRNFPFQQIVLFEKFPMITGLIVHELLPCRNRRH
jgi:hypothetical protein